MRPESGWKANSASGGQPARPPVFGRPRSQPGRWAVGLAAVFVVMWTISSFLLSSTTPLPVWWQIMLPFYGVVMLACGLGGGIAGVVAVIHRRERSLFVWLAILPGLFVIVFILAEILIPH
jgi:hypothetical protein